MRLHGGYNISIQGRPEDSLEKVSLPERLYLPLENRSFNYSQVSVAQGQRVSLGDVLAKDPDNHDVPLLCPCSGVVDLESEEGYIVLADISADTAQEYTYHDDAEHIHKKMGSAGLKRYKLLNLGAWEFFKEAYTGRTPDPLSTPQAIIVSTLRLEPFLVRGDVLLKEYLLQFTRGLEHLQSLLEYQPIYLVLPKIKADLALKIKEQIRGYAWVKVMEVPLKYPYDNFAVLSRHLNLKRSEGSVWGIHVDGALGVDRALTSSKPCTERVISVGGPGAKRSVHLQVPIGYPIERIMNDYAQDDVIAIEGGILTGRALNTDAKGVTTDCRGMTFVPELTSREFLGWLRPGFNRKSFSNAFISSLRGVFPEHVTNAMRGERRPCVSCGFCEEACPAGIMPYILHKLIYQDDIDTVEKFRIDLCVECGLCSFVCPSKIELMQQFKDMKQTIVKEREIAAAELAKKAEKETSQEGVGRKDKSCCW